MLDEAIATQQHRLAMVVPFVQALERGSTLRITPSHNLLQKSGTLPV